LKGGALTYSCPIEEETNTVRREATAPGRNDLQWDGTMRVIETVDEVRQHIAANLRGLAKSAVDRSKESRQRCEAETDEHLKATWRKGADTELRIWKMINEEVAYAHCYGQVRC
jgi:hypothetical protein